MSLCIYDACWCHPKSFLLKTSATIFDSQHIYSCHLGQQKNRFAWIGFYFVINLMTKNWCRGPESNRYESLDSTDFKSVASACSATPANVEAAPRIELGIKVLQTSALPLGYAATMERETRFELATLALARRCSTTELFPHDGASGQNRTADTRIFSPLLYRLSYRGK